MAILSLDARRRLEVERATRTGIVGGRAAPSESKRRQSLDEAISGVDVYSGSSRRVDFGKSPFMDRDE